jgi:hypothetical protein
MKRRDFLKKSTLTAASGLVLPYILPSGRLFAPSGRQMSGHVVLVMFAGGVRHQEAVGQTYLDGSQINEPYAGNIMYNMLTGAAPTQKIVYGTGQGGINPIPQILGSTIQQQGTLFKEVSALSAGHYGGLNSLVQGSSVTTQGLKQRPLNPTVFEYLRRHGGYSATDCWFPYLTTAPIQIMVPNMAQTFLLLWLLLEIAAENLWPMPRYTTLKTSSIQCMP